MPDITLTEEQYAELISNTVNNTADAVSIVAQKAIAGKLKEALSSDLDPIAQVKAVYAVIAKLEKGDLQYD